MSTQWLSNVNEITDGSQVSAAVVNAVTNQLVQRDQYLYEQIGNIANKSVLIAYNVAINPSETGLGSGNVPFVCYYNNNLITGAQGIIRAESAFLNGGYSSFYAPNNSCYPLGMIQAINSNGTANLYISGLINFTTPINDPTYGILDYVTGTTRETFVPGPYFLSRKNPGLITSNPSGLVVQVGYALTTTLFLLTPNVNQFSQLYANYQFDVLDRPTGTPVNTAGVFTIPSSTTSRLGWVDVNNLGGSYIIPSGAKFFYNIPATFTVDQADNSGAGSLSTAEIAAATELRGLLPPDPANFVSYFCNGVLQEFLTTIDSDGIYTIDSYGIWWYSNTIPPWATTLPTGWVPANWPTTKGDAAHRMRMYTIFAKLNPNLQSTAVTSLTAYPDGTPNVLSITNPTTGVISSVGALDIQFNLPTTNNTLTSSATALASVAYNQTSGSLTQNVIPVVSTLTATTNSGLTVTSDGVGNYQVSVEGVGSTGPVTIQELGSSNYEDYSNSLNQYLRLKYSTAAQTVGFRGFFNLPKLFPNNQSIKIYINLFGFQTLTSTQQSAAFTFEYTCNTAQNSAATAGTKSANSVSTGALLPTTTFTTGSTLADIVFPANYIAYTSNVYQPAQFVIPLANIGPDTNVNFRVYRTTSSLYTPYNYDIGMLSCYWSLI